MMTVDWLWNVQQGLQQAMKAGRPEQVLPTHHVGYALKAIIDHDREVVTCGHFLARKDEIAPCLRPRHHQVLLTTRSRTMLDPGEIASTPTCRHHIETKSIRGP